MLQEKHRQENFTQPWKEMRSPMGGFTHYNIDSWKLQHTHTHTHTQGQTGRAVLIDCPQRMKILFQCLPFHRRIRRAQSVAYWQLQQAGKKCDKEKLELFYFSECKHLHLVRNIITFMSGCYYRSRRQGPDWLRSWMTWCCLHPFFVPSTPNCSLQHPLDNEHRLHLLLVVVI